jgi:mRNA interferase MazF
MEVSEGDVFLAKMDPTVGVEIRKTRPVIVVSNDWINKFSQLAVIVPLTSSTQKVSPSHILIPQGKPD